MEYTYELTLGLPHTNRRGLWEPLLLMYAGHFQWQSIASAIGRPLSELRTLSGGEVYAAFYYIEERLPDATPIESFGLDETVRFIVALRSFKNIAVEGRVVFDRAQVLRSADPDSHRYGDELRHPSIRFGNIFITPVHGNSSLSVAPPANADFSRIPPLPNDDNPYHLTRLAGQAGSLGLIPDGWPLVGGPFDFHYQIDPDRDTNGAGLVYFANYITFIETAERAFFDTQAFLGTNRSVRCRRTAYYGNADIHDELCVRVSVFKDPVQSRHLGHRCAIHRRHDGQSICLSEAIKAVV